MDSAARYDTFARHPLQPLNKLYWYYERILRAHGSNANSCDWLVLNEPPDLSALAAAARLVAERHPVLRARVVGGVWTSPFWVTDAEAGPEIVAERRPGAAPENAADALSGNVWARPLDLTRGPPWRVHVTDYDDCTCLQVVTTHLFTDGKSANRLIGDLVTAYASVLGGAEFDATPVAPSTRDMGTLYLASLTPARRRGAYLNAVKGIVHEAVGRPVGLPLASRRMGRTRVALLDLGSAIWCDLRRTARAEGVSRHPFYVGAMSEAVAGFNADHGGRTKGTLKLIDNFSIRGFASEDVDSLYELAAVPYAMETPVTEHTDATFRRAVFERIEHLRGGAIIDELARYKLYMASAALAPKRLSTRIVLGAIVKSNVLFSNIGPVPCEIHEDRAMGIRDYYSFSQLFPPGRLMIFLSSTEATLRAVCLWNDAALSADQVQGDFLPRFRSALRRHATATVEGPSVPSV